jgi:hypothetical protein
MSQLDDHLKIYQELITLDAEIDEVRRQLFVANLTIDCNKCPCIRDYLVVFLAAHNIQTKDCDSAAIMEQQSYDERVKYAIPVPKTNFEVTSYGKQYTQLLERCSIIDRNQGLSGLDDYLVFNPVPTHFIGLPGGCDGGC